jgi:hypothetical protein
LLRAIGYLHFYGTPQMIVKKLSNSYILYPNIARVGELQRQGAKGEAVVNLLQPLGNAGSGVLQLSLRVNNRANSTPSF